jgi:glucose-6-phosphate-specific signal transduction histidine kinase
MISTRGSGGDLEGKAKESSSQVWYRAHPARALIAASCLFVVVTGLQLLADSSGEAMSVLYTLPIALLAVAFGRRGGWIGATLGFALFAVFAVFHSTGDLDATGWMTRGTAMFLLGGLLGHATDRTLASERRALSDQRRRTELEAADRREHEAMELNDSIIQGMAAAKWMVEQGRTEEAIEALTATIDRGQHFVAAILPRSIGDPGTSPNVSNA